MFLQRVLVGIAIYELLSSLAGWEQKPTDEVHPDIERRSRLVRVHIAPLRILYGGQEMLQSVRGKYVHRRVIHHSQSHLDVSVVSSGG